MYIYIQTRNYDTECSNHHPSLSTLTSKGTWNGVAGDRLLW